MRDAAAPVANLKFWSGPGSYAALGRRARHRNNLLGVMCSTRGQPDGLAIWPDAEHHRTQAASSLLLQATSAGRFASTASPSEVQTGDHRSGTLEETEAFNAGGVRFRYRRPVRSGPPFASELLEALDREATGEARREGDAELLHGLRNKSMLFFGDSTDGNVWTRICHCSRERGPRYARSVVGNLTRSRQRLSCYAGHHFGPRGASLSDDFKTCRFSRLGLHLHFSDAVYAVHPWGTVWQREASYLPAGCGPELEPCLHAKWLSSWNSAGFGFRAMRDGLAPQPTMVSVNVNAWFWVGVARRKPARRGWTQHVDAYVENASRLVCALQRMLPRARLWAVHTSVLPHYDDRAVNFKGGRRMRPEALSQTAHLNSAIRGLADSLALGLADWEAMLHLGWRRLDVLEKGSDHALEVFNAAVANIYLNALAML